ncbi:GFA family protein [Streptomyces californicus]|uniref:GFA family protein n=1 Tax=Streptomyces californicus TaxID=67351 RepID=UPI0037BC59E0
MSNPSPALGAPPVPAQSGFPRATPTWANPEARPTWYSTRPTLHRGFCPTCGTTLVSAAEGSPVIMGAAFSLADRSGTEPGGHRFHEQATPWMAAPLADRPSPPPATL